MHEVEFKLFNISRSEAAERFSMIRGECRGEIEREDNTVKWSEDETGEK
jgi:hypothetical protein